MSEQEHIYKHEWKREQEGSSHISEAGDEVVEIEDLDESEGRVFSRWPVRLLVVALLASFLLCLVSLWFSGTLLSAPDRLLPVGFLQLMANYRVLVLLVPVACLVICYGVLRSFTREIMAVPERYLDERQKMLRDQAHRSAFKIIRFACLLIPCGFLLPHLPWFNRPAVTYFAPLQIVLENRQVYTTSALNWRLDYGAFDRLQFTYPFVAPATTAEIVLAGALLLFCLWLIVSALPMAVLAWKGKK